MCTSISVCGAQCAFSVMEDKRSAPYIAYRCVQLQAQNRLTMGSKKLLLCFLFLLENVVLSSSQWPYHQIYPPLNESDDRTSLYFAVVLSFGGERVSIGALPGVQIALDHINSQPSILPGYTLHYTLTNSEVSYCFRCSAEPRVVLSAGDCYRFT